MTSGFMIRILVSLLLCFLAATAHLEAATRDRVTEKVLPNGLKVILLQNHKSPIVAFQVWYRVGSRNENWGKTGLSHMLEHMMFKGTKTRKAEEFTRSIQMNGGSDNAVTSYDFTAYLSTVSADRVDIPLELEADRMENLVLREEDFRTERLVVMEERRQRTVDDPQVSVEEQVMAAAFQVQPYHWPALGWMKDIEAITLNDLKTHYRAYYHPSNAFLVVVGDFDANELLLKIEKRFGAIPKGPVPEVRTPVEEPQQGERRIVVKREAKLPYLSIAYHVPNLRDPDGYVLEVISGILSGGKSSRLFEGLVREKGLALYVSSYNTLLSVDPGVFLLSATPMAGRTVEEVEKALDEEMGKLRTGLVSEEELERAKNQAEAGFVYGQDSFFYQAVLLGQNEIVMDWRKLDDYVPSIRKVTAEDVRRVARKYLVPENRTVGILAPVAAGNGVQTSRGRASEGHGFK